MIVEIKNKCQIPSVLIVHPNRLEELWKDYIKDKAPAHIETKKKLVRVFSFW